MESDTCIEKTLTKAYFLRLVAGIKSAINALALPFSSPLRGSNGDQRGAVITIVSGIMHTSYHWTRITFFDKTPTFSVVFN